ncbi:hypothetical protein [Methanocella paludicola]|uniref:hypothetical protein n=1 Tax=Methanocella paludicola TaxID=570267 RepID=UPI0010086302|nr:hypothetical protein [Methanocella paludicola]
MRSIHAILIMAACLAAMMPASAGLAGLQFGFPVLVQSGQSVSYSNDIATMTDLESINIDFPMFDGLMSGTPSAGVMDTGLAMGPMITDMSAMGSLFDFSRFKLH